MRELFKVLQGVMSDRYSSRHWMLAANLNRLDDHLKASRPPRIGILGQPGAGKSSLLDAMTKGRANPRPVIGVETDATDWSVSDASIAMACGAATFVDFPGYGTEAHPTELLSLALSLLKLDRYVLVLSGKITADDERVIQSLEDQFGRDTVLVVRSKAEDLDVRGRREAVADIRRRLSSHPGCAVFLTSSRTTEGIEELRSALALDARPASGAEAPVARKGRMCQRCGRLWSEASDYCFGCGTAIEGTERARREGFKRA